MLMLLHHQRPDGEVDTYHLKPGRRFHIGRGSSCEVRILDLSLSRKHCAVEFSEERWMVVDLMSTNGCKLDGDPVVGSLPIGDGGVITAGQTTLVAALRALPDGGAAPERTRPGAISETVPAMPMQLAMEQESLPADSSQDGTHMPEHRVANRDWEPQSAAAKAPSGVLEPRQLEVRYGQPAAAAPAATDERRYVISVLGMRVGPLTHAEARVPKAREQQGRLTIADLEPYPRQA